MPGVISSAGSHPLIPPAPPPSTTGRLTVRRQFLALNDGARAFGAGLVLQTRPRDYPGAGEASGSRVGFTVTKKIGNAVTRNRVRRRLKEAVRALDGHVLRATHDYVVIGRKPALTLPYETLRTDLERAIRAAHRASDAPASPSPRTASPRARNRPRKRR